MIRRLYIWRWETTTQLRVAAVATLIALALMVWSMLDPTPLPVMLAMSVAQGLGTLAFALYGAAVWKDLRRIRRERRESSQSIPLPKADKEPSS